MKYKRFIIVFLFLIMLVGCDKKKSLVCTKSEKTTGMNVTTKRTTNFINDKMGSVDLNITIKLENDYIKYIKTIKSGLEEEYSEYKNKKGVKYQISNNKDTIDIAMQIDSKSISKKTKKDLELADISYDDSKKSLTDDGYTCK